MMKLEKLFLEENVGGWDLFLRAAAGSAGIVLLAMGFFAAPISYLAAFISFVGLFSGMTRHCTPYSLVGISTKKK